MVGTQKEHRKGDVLMRPKTIEQIELMKKQTIGVEIEFTGMTRERAASIVAGHFGTVAYHIGGGYDAWEIPEAETNRRWKVMFDSSIVSTGNRRDTKCELVTPILHYEDIETLQEIVRKLRKAGAISNPSHMCGVHIHIGADGHTAQTLRNLANLMASRERLIAKAIRIGRYRTNYCAVTDTAFLERLNTKKPKTMDELKHIWYNDTRDFHAHYDTTRYHMLNLHATFTKGTVEFRLFNFAEPDGDKKNGLHAGELKAWIQLCLAMNQRAKDVKTVSPKQPQCENEKFAMRVWLKGLNLIGDEFKTARTLLTRNLDGNSAWRYGVQATA